MPVRGLGSFFETGPVGAGVDDGGVSSNDIRGLSAMMADNSADGFVTAVDRISRSVSKKLRMCLPCSGPVRFFPRPRAAALYHVHHDSVVMGGGGGGGQAPNMIADCIAWSKYRYRRWGPSLSIRLC